MLGDIKYLMRLVQQAVEAVGIRTEDNWDVKRVNSLFNQREFLIGPSVSLSLPGSSFRLD